MKVAQINTVYEYGSTGRNCSELCGYLRENGVDCVNIYSKGKKSDGGYVVASVLECKLAALLSRVTGYHAHNSLISTNRLLKILSKEKPDVVCLNNLHSNYVNLPQLLSFLSINQIPTVAILHDCWFYTGYCTHYTYIRCDKWKRSCGDCKYVIQDGGTWFFDRTKQMWDDKKKYFNSITNLAVVGVSKWITNEAKKSPIFGRAKEIVHIGNWIDLSVFRPKYSNKKIEGFSVLVEATKWYDMRNCEVKKNLLSNLWADCKILLLGNEQKDEIDDPRVINLGYINNIEKLVEVYNTADCYLHMSYEDSFGKIVAESMACGTPVIVYDSTALPEFVVNERCGYVVKPGDGKDIICALDKIRGNGKKYYKDECVSLAKEKFEKQKQCVKYLELFKRMVGENSVADICIH
ncbi:glycosyltransferase [Heliophilum fasciatum]|uniref:Glycosyltransferase involved in cell wall biosynthesis n=1 Tax=Heliophilum fasciatum TaxID=35700 RepID=A0A4R2RW22_9FIRM|nr:glycosyltransferase [Heliophilum fasciatum]MCW2278079.1 glycosyltransferase involved in cell wall biosynthesis [Heliophilum fasciatum]TCP64151.1 glycosyltransferase involved in cell wall biosynthesis [Heliophilum fasciatum]